MIHCLHCGAETTNGLALCELCRRYAQSIFETLPISFANLARWKPGRVGSRPVPGSRVLYDGTVRGSGTGDKISDSLDEALNMLTTRARQLADDRGGWERPLTLASAVLLGDLSDETAYDLADNPHKTAAALCVAFSQNLTSISTLGWCGDFVRDLSHHGDRLLALMPLVPGWYAGGCRQVVGFDDDGAAVRCETPTAVTPGLTWVTCDGCGATTYARDHLDVVLDEARDAIMRPKALAEAIVALVDTEGSVPRLHTRIRQWVYVGELKPIRHTTRGYKWDAATERMVVVDEETGHARYRVGDVLDLVLRNTRSLKRTGTS